MNKWDSYLNSKLLSFNSVLRLRLSQPPAWAWAWAELGKNIVNKDFFGSEIFWALQKILAKKNMGVENFLSRKVFGSISLGQFFGNLMCKYSNIRTAKIGFDSVFTNIINLNFIKGVEDSLPACGNDCIYRKESEGNEGQLYCFPTSYSDLQNNCDPENMRPKPCKTNK